MPPRRAPPRGPESAWRFCPALRRHSWSTAAPSSSSPIMLGSRLGAALRGMPSQRHKVRAGPNARSPCIPIAGWECRDARDGSNAFARGSCQSTAVAALSEATNTAWSTFGLLFPSTGTGKRPTVAPPTQPEEPSAMSMHINPYVPAGIASCDCRSDAAH